MSAFCLELSKKLDMKYKSPPLPVDLAFLNRMSADEAKAAMPKAQVDPAVTEEVAAMFSIKK